MKVTRLFIYPVKSLGGIELKSTTVGLRGFDYDRHWVIVDENNRFMSQREHKKMALLKCKFEGMCLEIHSSKDHISIDIRDRSEVYEDIQVWDDTIHCEHVSSDVDKWLSEVLNQPVRMFCQTEKSPRRIDPKYAHNNEQTSLSDGYPILMLSQASLDLLNSKLAEPIDFDRFRPNIVIDGVDAHEEDNIGEVYISNTLLKGVKPCARCVMTTIDQKTGMSGPEPLATLNTYRKEGNKILFGQNMLVIESRGEICVGDNIFLE